MFFQNHRSFIVEKDGSVRDAKITKSVHADLDSVALQMVKQATFTPEKYNGEIVSIRYNLPIDFKLEDD
ncbi:energy transducer TonB [Kordia jejudonensis]|uniref:energy transducer TonB n=1 Tax=Kordia jejudonensis TaxID=1348245 RepID=UPI00069C4CDA|nr:energy transducer TonB [Kordia jejudonensis]